MSLRLLAVQILHLRRSSFKSGSCTHSASCRMRALGAKLIGVRQAPWDSSQASALDALFTERFQWPQLHEAAGKADIIVLTCTVTDATRGMIDEAFLGRCKEGVIIINVARGGSQLVQLSSCFPAQFYASKTRWRSTLLTFPMALACERGLRQAFPAQGGF